MIQMMNIISAKEGIMVSLKERIRLIKMRRLKLKKGGHANVVTVLVMIKKKMHQMKKVIMSRGEVLNQIGKKMNGKENM